MVLLDLAGVEQSVTALLEPGTAGHCRRGQRLHLLEAQRPGVMSLEETPQQPVDGQVANDVDESGVGAGQGQHTARGPLPDDAALFPPGAVELRTTGRFLVDDVRVHARGLRRVRRDPQRVAYLLHILDVRSSS